MQERYEQAIKETFAYLDECVKRQPNRATIQYLLHLGIDRRYVIEKQMKNRGFEVKCDSTPDLSKIVVYPPQDNLPIHMWREKDVY